MSTKWAWLGVVATILGVLAAPSPAFSAIIPASAAMIFAFLGAVVAALSTSIVGLQNKTITWIGVGVALVAVVTSPQFTGLLPQNVTEVAALIGSVLAAFGGGSPTVAGWFRNA